jgi:LacI family transcriptional regulator
MARRRQSVTIKHVAADAGVSLQTVSRVINNGASVRPALKAHVQASIDKLGYVPSIAAQRMSGSKSYLILAINDRDRTIADWRARQGRDWVDQMLLGGMLKCAEHGYRMIFELIDTHSDHVERELAAAIASLQPDGVILTPPHSENPLIIGLLAKHNIPFARIGSQQDGPGIAMTMGDGASARLATQYLLDLGHKQIGFIAGSSEFSLSRWRVEGWSAAMVEAGLNSESLLVWSDFSYEGGAIAANALLSLAHPPTAIIASNDQMALATLDTAIEKGLHVPDDLSLISFDNSPVMRFTTPQLTAIDQPIAETFSKAVELLIANSEGPPPSQPIMLDSLLVSRGSTAPPGSRNHAG